MAVKVILKKAVPDLGEQGDVKHVAAGYFRNFLLPRGLAVEATKGQMKALEASSKNRDAQSSRARAQSNTAAEQLSGVTLRMPVKMGEQGRIHGAVTNKDIAEALVAQVDFTVDRHKIDLAEPLKSIGSHTVSIKLDHGVEATVAVELVPDAETT